MERHQQHVFRQFLAFPQNSLTLGDLVAANLAALEGRALETQGRALEGLCEPLPRCLSASPP